MILEMRTYMPVKGRQEQLLARFRDGTMSIFSRCNINIVHFWVTEDEGEIIYICEWDNIQNMKDTWSIFREDREWKQLKGATEADGPLVEKIVSKVVTTPDFFRNRQR